MFYVVECVRRKGPRSDAFATTVEPRLIRSSSGRENVVVITGWSDKTKSKFQGPMQGVNGF